MLNTRPVTATAAAEETAGLAAELTFLGGAELALATSVLVAPARCQLGSTEPLQQAALEAARGRRPAGTHPAADSVEPLDQRYVSLARPPGLSDRKRFLGSARGLARSATVELGRTPIALGPLGRR